MPGFQNTPPKKNETSMEHPPFRLINVFLTYLLAGWLLLHHPQHFTTASTDPFNRPLPQSCNPVLPPPSTWARSRTSSLPGRVGTIFHRNPTQCQPQGNKALLKVAIKEQCLISGWHWGVGPLDSDEFWACSNGESQQQVARGVSRSGLDFACGSRG